MIKDQAHQLRRLAALSQQEVIAPGSQPPRVIAVSSGKGGVGKTNVVANLGLALAAAGHNVMVLDADLGLANIDVVLGLNPQHTLAHVLAKQKTIMEIIVEGPNGIRVIPGGFGLAGLADLPDSQREELIVALTEIEGQFDVLLIDTSAGISPNVLRFIVAAGEVIVVTTPEPTAMTDAYALIKVVAQQNRKVLFRLLVNMVSDSREAGEVIRTMTEVAKRFIGVTLKSYGFLPSDANLSRAVRKQVPLLLAYPGSPLSRAVVALSERVLTDRSDEQDSSGARQFFQRMATREEVGARGG